MTSAISPTDGMVIHSHRNHIKSSHPTGQCRGIRFAGIMPAICHPWPSDFLFSMKPRSFFVAALGTALVFLCAGTAAFADCFDAAGRYQHVNPLILRAIAWRESHNRPNALNHNANGSTDYGVMQINSVHLPALAQYGISTHTLMQPCKNVYIAAWHLRREMDKYGNTWAAVGAYHSETPALRDEYAQQIAQIIVKWHVFIP